MIGFACVCISEVVKYGRTKEELIMCTTVNKKDLAAKLVAEYDLSKKVAEGCINTVFEEIMNTLKEDGVVDIYGFGKFSLSERAARMGLNPATGEKIEIPASKAVKFKASKSLKDAVK